jgi:tripartite ATP-independent transporter DctM subunit
MSLEVFMILFLVLLLLGLPIGFVMLVSSFAYMLLSGNPLYVKLIPEKIFEGISSFVLTSIPFFMLAGEVMNRTGISARLIEFASLIVGRLRGGLAHVNILSSMLFAGITGVALGEIAALGTVFIPSMEKKGYSKEFAAAVTACASIIGPIIPPSIIIILYSAIMDVSVGAMFAGAFLPGVLIGVSDMLVVVFLSIKRKYPKSEIKLTPQLLLGSFKHASVAIMMPLIIVGGILSGIFTPTEAAAGSVVYAILVGVLFYRNVKLIDLWEACKTAAVFSCKLFFIISGISLMTWIFGMEKAPLLAENLFRSISQDKTILILMINVLYLFSGMFMEPSTSIILFAPIIWPMVAKLGLNEIQFGLMIVINTQIGLLTPPVGNVLFAISEMVKTDLMRLSREMLPFILINFIVVLLIGFVPEITLIFPRWLGFIN